MKVSPSWANTHFVDSFATAELVFPEISVIGLTLYDSNGEPDEAGHRDLPFRFRLSSDRARALAAALAAAADEIDGTGQPSQ